MRCDQPLKTLPVVLLLCLGDSAFAHCDTLDGPVVAAARAALETADPDPVLIWVQPEHEPEVRSAFERTLRVRTLDAPARELADMYFFETVVRLHREGEGAPYTGLKPAGAEFGPAIAAADRALETASPEDLITLLTDSVSTGLYDHFEDALSKKEFDPGDVAAGRRYVASYVQFVHYVERIHEAATSPALHHFPEHE